MTDVVSKQNDGWSPGPTYLDFEDVFEALDRIRRRNRHGFGHDEPVTLESDDGDVDTTLPWLSEPFEEDGRALDAGSGILLPFVVASDDEDRTVGEGALDPDAPRRTRPSAATLDAVAAALAGLQSDGRGVYHPVAGGDRLAADAVAKWLRTGDDAPPEGAVAVVTDLNLGVQVDPAQVRRGDVLQIDWDPAGSHAVVCWDAHPAGSSVWLQIVSSQAQTHGVGVLLSNHAAARTGTLERVRRQGSEGLVWVVRHDLENPWLTTREARRFYRGAGNWFRTEPQDGDDGGRISKLSVGRFHRLFPRYPLALSGSNLVSSPGPKRGSSPGEARTREASSELGFDNNERTPGGGSRAGGFFPIAASRTWHGGVHLYPEADASVRAPVDAVLVAARLTAAGGTGGATGADTDAGFVLLKTRLELQGQEVAFFTLLYHLAAHDEDAGPVPWLDALLDLPPEEDAGWTSGLDPAKDHARVVDAPSPRPDDDPRHGADGPDGGLLVFEKRDRTLESLGSIASGTVVELLASHDEHGWTKLRGGGVEGFVFGEGRLELVDPQEYDSDLRKKRASLLAGDVVDLSDLPRRILVRAGEVVGSAGKVAGETAVHFQVFSKDMLPFLGKTKPDVEDSGGDLFTDRTRFEQSFFKAFDQTDEGGGGDGSTAQHFMIKSATSKDDDALWAGEVQDFYARSPLAKNMRTVVTRHLSEWSEKIDWTKLDSDPTWQHATPEEKQAFQAEVARHGWWKAGFLESEGLPGDHVAHHYHPIAFLSWLDEQREADADGSLHASVVNLNHA